MNLYRNLISEKAENYYDVKLFNILEQIVKANKEIIHYENIVSHKEFTNMRLEHAEHLIEIGDLLKAKEILNNIDDESNLDVQNNLVVIAILEERFEDSLEIILNILQKNPTDEIALNNLQYLKSLFGEKKDELNKFFHKDMILPKAEI